MNEVKCVFETKLSPGDVAKLNKIIGAVIPVTKCAPLISPIDVGLHRHVSHRTDYGKLHMALNMMYPTVLRKLEGNQMVMTPMQHGQVYTIRNTGPFSWEVGDRLAIIPPVFSIEHTTIMQTPSWDLMLPIVVPVQVAKEINIRNIVITLMSLNRPGRDAEISQEARRIRFRDVTIDIPTTLDTRQLNSVRNVCLALALITNVAPSLLQQYVPRLALAETDMLLVKCYDLLKKLDLPGDGNGGEPPNIPNEIQRMSGLLNLITYVNSIVTENSLFIVNDITPDNKMATCTFTL
ncbi:triplex capsid protein 2 [Elephant endotheliotropic herpesvirus 2]|nr:triplex capsid protein 2 [Elephant endotheliotropic herpesvirus 2]